MLMVNRQAKSLWRNGGPPQQPSISKGSMFNQMAGVMKAPPAGLETLCLDGVLQPDWGENFLLSEGVEQSGEQAAFALHLCSAVTALTAP